jgi:deoxyribonuclease-4
MYLGAHVSSAGGLEKSVGRALEIGAEAMQLFPSSPRMWRFKMTPEANIAKFKSAVAEANMGPTVFHGIYLCALAAEDEALLARSIDSLTNYLKLAEAIQVEGVLFHPASHKGRGYETIEKQFVDAVHHVLKEAPGTPWLALENSAGMGDHIGSKFEELGRLIKAIDSPRIKVCFDTQHAFAAGYDIATPDGVAAAMDEFDREIGVNLIKAVHCNDSKTPLGSSVDRHENIGEGEIGVDGFEAIMSHPAFADVPFYLEVPGFEKGGPDKQNMDLAKVIRKRTQS